MKHIDKQYHQRIQSHLTWIVDKIQNELLNANITSQTNGLYTGWTGELYFLSSLENNAEHGAQYDLLLNSVLNSPQKNFSVCSGLTGVLFAHKNSSLSDSYSIDQESMEALRLVVRSAIPNMLQIHNWDYLHGGLGTALMFPDPQNNELDLEVHQLLCKYFVQNEKKIAGKGSTWYSRLHTDESIFGFAHGVPSIMWFLCDCIEKGVMVPECIGMISRAVVHLRANELKSEGPTRSFFPNMAFADKNSAHDSRLGWCYGDLTIAYVLNRVGGLVNDPSIQEYAKEIVDYTLLRKSFQEAMCRDASFCHGSSGIAILYWQLHKFFQDDKYLEQAHHWLKLTLESGEFSKKDDYQYWFFNGHVQEWEDNSTLLDGLAGVGMVYATFLGLIDDSWTRVFSLSPTNKNHEKLHNKNAILQT